MRVDALRLPRLLRLPPLSRWAAAIAAVRRVCGMPDYESYVAHLRAAHPERPVPTRREFFHEYVQARYGDGPTRCC